VRTGGFNTLTVATDYSVFSPEKNWSYETGFKGWALNQRLRYSAALYWMNIDNMQVLQIPAPSLAYVASAATATSKGLELDVDYLLRGGWQLKAELAVNRTRFDHFIDGAVNHHGKHSPSHPT